MKCEAKIWTKWPLVIFSSEGLVQNWSLFFWLYCHMGHATIDHELERLILLIQRGGMVVQLEGGSPSACRVRQLPKAGRSSSSARSGIHNRNFCEISPLPDLLTSTHTLTKPQFSRLTPRWITSKRNSLATRWSWRHQICRQTHRFVQLFVCHIFLVQAYH